LARAVTLAGAVPFARAIRLARTITLARAIGYDGTDASADTVRAVGFGLVVPFRVVCDLAGLKGVLP